MMIFCFETNYSKENIRKYENNLLINNRKKKKNYYCSIDSFLIAWIQIFMVITRKLAIWKMVKPSRRHWFYIVEEKLFTMKISEIYQGVVLPDIFDGMVYWKPWSTLCATPKLSWYIGLRRRKSVPLGTTTPRPVATAPLYQEVRQFIHLFFSPRSRPSGHRG